MRMDPAEALRAMRSATRPTVRLLGGPPPTGSPRVALFPGSFDPPTVGHVALAEAAAREVDLVLLVYATAPLPKGPGASPPLLDEPSRIEALSRLARARPSLMAAVASHGLLVDQVEAVGDALPGSRIVLAVGSDKFLQVLDPAWYEDRDAAMRRLFDRAFLRYAVRGEDEDTVRRVLSDPANARWVGSIGRLDLPGSVAKVSSSLVRERLRRGEPVDRLVPPEVLPLLPRGSPG
jgi:cytidyltransferase-like protein